MSFKTPNPTQLAFVVIAFCLGLLVGWRATITHLEVDSISPNRIEVTAWGQTDLFVVSELDF